MPYKVLHKAVINLLLLAMVMQPLLVLGQSTQKMTESSARTMHMAMMDCCAGGEQHDASGHSGYDMACGAADAQGCSLATSMGSCGAQSSALASVKDDVPAQSSSDLNPLHPYDCYLSIILDTLTPPPNSSKA